MSSAIVRPSHYAVPSLVLLYSTAGPNLWAWPDCWVFVKFLLIFNLFQESGSTGTNQWIPYSLFHKALYNRLLLFTPGIYNFEIILIGSIIGLSGWKFVLLYLLPFVSLHFTQMIQCILLPLNIELYLKIIKHQTQKCF